MKRFLLILSFLLFGLSLLLAAETSVDVLIKTDKSWNGDPLPRYGRGKPEITVLKISVPPHTTLDWHQHPVINAAVILSGQLTVITVQKDTLYLKAGDPIVEVVNTIHYGRNDGDTPTDLIVFYAGKKGKAITIKEKQYAE